ncbi:hypothetical protein D5H78_10845 [Vallicoccus soli]|uniref:YdbS-like PH domain-containing protein n=1 Tax=Vallicoccus soli TaxID=2339232 RepID=A0A3A3YX56_9ACTN|nr:hypothetical protein D5H78_10845 [Vallicoccus soli]
MLGRLHPLTPVLRGWRFVVAALAVLVPQNADLLGGGQRGLLRLGTGVAVLLLVGGVAGVLAWRFTRYGIDGGDLRVDSGVLFRRSRRVRLDRLQAVDVVQPLLARLLGMAELRLEVAGGSSTEAPLAYLSLDDAHRLRNELLARAAGIEEDAPEAPERLLHEVPGGRLLASSLLTTPVVVGVVLVPVALGVAAVVEGVGSLLFLAPALLSIAQPLLQQFLANFGFTLAESPDGLRLRRGLLEKRAQTVPPGRIQAVRVVEPWLWRRFTDWVRLDVDIAGYGAGQQASSAQLLPVAPRHEVLALLERVLPGASLPAVRLEGVPRRAAWLAPLTRRVLGAGYDDRYFVARRGLLERETDVMPHERAQSVRVTQGPLQRRLGLASLTLDTTPGPVTVRAEHRDAREAVALALHEAELARRARAAAPPERWMAAHPAAPVVPPALPDPPGDGPGAGPSGAGQPRAPYPPPA